MALSIFHVYPYPPYRVFRYLVNRRPPAIAARLRLINLIGMLDDFEVELISFIDEC